MIQKQAAGCIIYTLDEMNLPQYLVLRYQVGHWDFAKGHTEPQESLVQTAEREVFEETGLAIHANEQFHYTYSYHLSNKNHQSIHKTVHLFIACSMDKSITLSAEHSDYAWLAFDQALRRVTYSNAQEALKAANSWLAL